MDNRVLNSAHRDDGTISPRSVISHLKRVRILSLALHLVTGTSAYAESTTGTLHGDPVSLQNLYRTSTVSTLPLSTTLQAR